jgi:hypothetical protein
MKMIFSLLIANGVVGIREMWTKMEEMPQVYLWRKQFHQQPRSITQDRNRLVL